MDMYKKEIKEQAHMFGIDNRINQTQEECAELIQALSKYRRKVLEKDKTCNIEQEQILYGIKEEIADVEICISQLKELLCISNMELEGIKSVKVERTKQRLNKSI